MLLRGVHIYFHPTDYIIIWHTLTPTTRKHSLETQLGKHKKVHVCGQEKQLLIYCFLVTCGNIWINLLVKLNGSVVSNSSLPISRNCTPQLHQLFPITPTHLEPQVQRAHWWIRHVPYSAVSMTHGPPLLAILLHPLKNVNVKKLLIFVGKTDCR